MRPGSENLRERRPGRAARRAALRWGRERREHGLSVSIAPSFLVKLGDRLLTWQRKNVQGCIGRCGGGVERQAAREHGSYQLMQKELTLGAKPVSGALPGNEEIEGASIEYRRKK